MLSAIIYLPIQILNIFTKNIFIFYCDSPFILDFLRYHYNSAKSLKYSFYKAMVFCFVVRQNGCIYALQYFGG